MGVETATYIADLQATNPGSSDLRSQGDDHLRLLKTVLQATFPTATKAWYNPNIAAKSGDFTILAADMNKWFGVSTGGGASTVTLPSLVLGDAGWECTLYKYSTDANPMIITTPTGLIFSGEVASLTKTRRAIPGVPVKVFWTGSNYFISRAVNVPIGTCLEFHRATLPPGYEWPNGQTLASAATLYPDYNAVVGSGITLDVRGRVSIPLDNLGGSAAGRLAGGIITGTAVGNTGGSDTRTLLTANLPAYTPAGSCVFTGNSMANVVDNLVGYANGGGAFGFSYPASQSALTPTGSVSFTGTAQGGTSTAFGLLQPSIMCTKILVVE